MQGKQWFNLNPGLAPTSPMSEELFSHLIEDIQFVGSLDPMTIMGQRRINQLVYQLSL